MVRGRGGRGEGGVVGGGRGGRGRGGGKDRRMKEGVTRREAEEHVQTGVVYWCFNMDCNTIHVYMNMSTLCIYIYMYMYI